MATSFKGWGAAWGNAWGKLLNYEIYGSSKNRDQDFKDRPNSLSDLRPDAIKLDTRSQSIKDRPIAIENERESMQITGRIFMLGKSRSNKQASKR